MALVMTPVGYADANAGAMAGMERAEIVMVRQRAPGGGYVATIWHRLGDVTMVPGALHERERCILGELQALSERIDAGDMRLMANDPGDAVAGDVVGADEAMEADGEGNCGASASSFPPAVPQA